MPQFRLLSKVNSLRVAGKRYFPGDIVELTEEQASRLNSDIFANLDSAISVKESETIITDVPFIEAPKCAEIQMLNKAGKRSGKIKP